MYFYPYLISIVFRSFNQKCFHLVHFQLWQYEAGKIKYLGDDVCVEKLPPPHPSKNTLFLLVNSYQGSFCHTLLVKV